MNVRFVVTKPESKRKTFSVQLPILVGRSEEAKFRIQQDRVSRKHCEFFAQDGAVYLRDLGSTNGTFLNGQLVETSAKVPLEPGAVVKVGGLEFRVEFGATQGASVPGAAPVERVEEDRTVGLASAADSEHLQVEHAADATSDQAPAVLTAERPAPADEPPVVEATEAPSPEDEQPAAAPEAVADAEPSPADDAFGFLAGAEEPKPNADDDQLGDFLKGLK